MFLRILFSNVLLLLRVYLIKKKINNYTEVLKYLICISYIVYTVCLSTDLRFTYIQL